MRGEWGGGATPGRQLPRDVGREPLARPDGTAWVGTEFLGTDVVQGGARWERDCLPLVRGALAAPAHLWSGGRGWRVPEGRVGGCERVETTRGLWGSRRQRMSASWHPEGQELPAGAGQVHLPLCTFPQIRHQTRMRNFLATFVECLEV